MGLTKWLLGTERLSCAYDDKELGFPFYKVSAWEQYPLFSLRQLKQKFFGNNDVLRFCSRECFLKWVGAGGRMKG